ncbi:unnamed protein product [Symbiodinium sp. KB8]|nr:unnamed protein product [Symbiodinium sp. KB8]
MLLICLEGQLTVGGVPSKHLEAPTLAREDESQGPGRCDGFRAPSEAEARSAKGTYARIVGHLPAQGLSAPCVADTELSLPFSPPGLRFAAAPLLHDMPRRGKGAKDVRNGNCTYDLTLNPKS